MGWRCVVNKDQFRAGQQGIVVRDSRYPHRVSFKVLNNEALLKEKD
jgi:hypothetical protein